MKSKMFLVLSLIFTVLTLLGATYVLMSDGRESAGYAIIPMIFGIIFIFLWRRNR